MSDTDSSGTDRYECPDCETESTFSAAEGGPGSGNLSCDSCGYMPRRWVRDEIREMMQG